MRCVLRTVSLVAGAAILVWLVFHAGGYQEDGSPNDPAPPPVSLVIGGIVAVPVLWSYAAGLWGGSCCRRSDRAAGGG